MKVYPKQCPGCSAVGTSAGAIDPKTHRNWVWAYIAAVANLLVDVVVRRHGLPHPPKGSRDEGERLRSSTSSISIPHATHTTLACRNTRGTHETHSEILTYF